MMVGATLLLLGACRSVPPTAPDAARASWRTYSDTQGGYSVSYPDAYDVDEHGGGVLFRHEGYPVVSISHATEEQADDRGLWADHDPVGDAVLGGRPGKKYVYDHHDALSYMRTVSFVVEHRDRYLGLEFRTDLESPDDVQQRMLDSFTFD